MSEQHEGGRHCIGRVHSLNVTETYCGEQRGSGATMKIGDVRSIYEDVSVIESSRRFMAERLCQDCRAEAGFMAGERQEQS